ncbi:hypothetical protein B7P43_G03578 [Cryptotermes secundus]|uniref:Uncharacterized protein n=1 Tax=Cryptotermes secundus TaxID=105785 RepID=A0A2J7PCJ7_9NEOP|nr:hypothetical protein B7P43_G03578 [Cryptotermes secundus]
MAVIKLTSTVAPIFTDKKAHIGQHVEGYSFHAGFFLCLFFNPEIGSDIPPKRRLTFNELHGVFFSTRWYSSFKEILLRNVG